MSDNALPLVISAPEPRTLDLIFTPAALAKFRSKYRIVETSSEGVTALPADVLAETRYIVGQPPITPETLEKMKALRCVFNVESNLIKNMPYETLFSRGIHVVTTGLVFAEPVAELGLAMALNLARDIVDADLAFRQGKELWGGDGNRTARLLSGADVGIIGFGDLGRALNRLLSGFRTQTKVFDPWLPPSILIDNGVEPASLDDVLSNSDFVFVVASVTSENQGFLGAEAFAKMRKGAAFILLSRAGVVDFPALMNAVRSGHIVAASDVFPEEPLARDHPVRTLPGFLRSAHRAGALDIAFKRMGDMVLEDMDLIDRGLPPMRSKRAERETVSRMRSKPVDKN
ncbi:hydroxyacid dehydrogenase [Mesorhizobium sp. M0622]|uniref:hydroxyacid dehydrogenase n=1 Tax=unclassified Mesorhizobium TaxID=325217 RepID=UPI0033375D06